MVSTDLALARWADRARVAPQTARSVPMRPPATNAKMDNILPTPVGVITSAQMATTSLEKVMLGEFARLARLHATPVLDLTGAQSASKECS